MRFDIGYSLKRTSYIRELIPIDPKAVSCMCIYIYISKYHFYYIILYFVRVLLFWRDRSDPIATSLAFQHLRVTCVLYPSFPLRRLHPRSRSLMEAAGKGFADLDPVFGEAKAEWSHSSASPASPLHQFLFHARALDPSCLEIAATDFHSHTFDLKLTVLELEDLVIIASLLHFY